MLEIRKALPQDAQAILDFLKQIGSETDNLTFDHRGLPFTLEQERDYLAALARSDREVMFTAWVDGELAGTCSYAGFAKERLAHRGEVSICVRQAFWGRGIGRRLMEEVIQWAKTQGQAEIISLVVRSDNQRAIRLYEKLGFQKIGCFPGYMKIRGQWIDGDMMNLYLK